MMLSINSITGDDEKYWFTVKEFAALFEYNCKNETARVVTLLDQDVYRNNQYGIIKKVGRKIYIAPITAKRFCVYDIDNGELTIISDSKIEKDSPFKFRNVMIRQGKLFFWGGTLEVILIVDCSTDSLNVISLLNEKISDDVKAAQGQCYFATTSDNTVSINIKKSKYIVKYDVDSNLKVIDKNPLCSSISGLCRAGGQTFFFQEGGGIYCEVNESKLDSIALPVDFQGHPRSYIAGFYMNDKIWILPFKSNMIMTYRKGDRESVCCKKYDNKNEIIYQYGGQLDNKNIWAFNAFEDCLDIIDTCAEKIKKIQISSIDDMEIIFSKKIGRDVILHENSDTFTLERFINVI